MSGILVAFLAVHLTTAGAEPIVTLPEEGPSWTHPQDAEARQVEMTAQCAESSLSLSYRQEKNVSFSEISRNGVSLDQISLSEIDKYFSTYSNINVAEISCEGDTWILEIEASVHTTDEEIITTLLLSINRDGEVLISPFSTWSKTKAFIEGRPK